MFRPRLQTAPDPHRSTQSDPEIRRRLKSKENHMTTSHLMQRVSCFWSWNYPPQSVRLVTLSLNHCDVQQFKLAVFYIVICSEMWAGQMYSKLTLQGHTFTWDHLQPPQEPLKIVGTPELERDKVRQPWIPVIFHILIWGVWHFLYQSWMIKSIKLNEHSC